MRRIGRKRKEVLMSALKVVRNVLGTAGIMILGYVVLDSLKDARRYIKISLM